MSAGYFSSVSDLTGVLNVLSGPITGQSINSLGALSVSGPSTLQALAATTITASGAVSTGALTSSTLTCTGAANTGALTALSISTSGTASTGALTATSLSCSGTAATGALTAASMTTAGTLNVSGATSLTGATTIANTLTQTGSSNAVSFAGATTISNTLTQTGSGNAVTLAGATSLSNTLAVAGAATFSNTVSTGALTASSISTSGSVSAGALSAASVTTSGTLSVAGASTLSGATTVANTFTQTGSGNAVSLAGPTTLTNTLTLGAQVNYPNSIVGFTSADTGAVPGNGIRFRNTDSTNTGSRISIGNSAAAGLYDSRFVAYTLGTSPDVSTNYERVELGGNSTGAFLQYTVAGTGTVRPLTVYGSTVFAPAGAVSFAGAVTHTNAITQSGGAVSLGGATTLGSTLGVTGLVTASAGVSLPGAQALNFGSDQTKATSAGTIGYQALTVGALDIVGAGTAAGSRVIKLWDNIVVPGVINPSSGADIGQINSGTSSNYTTAFKGAGVRVGPSFDAAGTSHTIPLASALGDNFSAIIMVFVNNKKSSGKTGLMILAANKSAGQSLALNTILSSNQQMSSFSAASSGSSANIVVTTDSDCAVTYTQFIGS